MKLAFRFGVVITDCARFMSFSQSVSYSVLHRLIVRFFKDHPDQYGNTWGRPAPGATQWQPPLQFKNKDAG